jgi:plasmid maintenance system antidote protein VapI
MGASRVTGAELARRLGVSAQRVVALCGQDHLSEYMAARVEQVQADVALEDRARANETLRGLAEVPQ